MYKEEQKLAGINIDKPVIEIEHSKLNRVHKTSTYDSKCIKCEIGILPMHRNKKTLILEKRDFCLLCGQQVDYTDIEKLRKKDFARS